MRTEVDIVAERGRSLRWRCDGGLAVRQTGSVSAHLIGVAATPLGGDEIDIRVRVGPGATLDLGSVAATIALPTRDRADSVARWYIEVGADARLRLDQQPTIVAAGADHRSDITVDLSEGSTLDLHERVQVGRSAAELRAADQRGRWRGGVRVDVDGAPMLRHRLALGAGSTSHAAGLTAAASVLRYPDARSSEVDPRQWVARLDLPGGATLTTALASSVADAGALCDSLDVASLAH